MSWTTALAIYFVAWWVVLFLVLPFGVHSQQEEGAVVPGSDPGAPAMPLLLKKLIWNTILTALLCALFFWLFLSGHLTLNDLSTVWGLFPAR